MDINEVTILGSIKEISNISTLNNGQQCCWLNILTDVSYNKKDGTVGHIQDAHRVIAYGKYANVIKEKGSINQKIKIEGRLKFKKWVYDNTFFEKEFIVLERFRLYPPIQNESKEPPEGYDQQQDVVEEEYEERPIFEDNDYEMEELVEEYDELVVSLARSEETGWYYADPPEDSDDD